VVKRVEIAIAILIIISIACFYTAVKISKKQKPSQQKYKPQQHNQCKEHENKFIKSHGPDKSIPADFNFEKLNITTKKARKEYKNFTVFDLETTGLNPITDSIIEIGAVKIRDGQITESFLTFVNPGHCIPPDVTKINGITDAMVKDAPNISEVLPTFMQFIGDDVLVAHNAYSFDAKFLLYAAHKNSIEIKNPIVDTLPLCRKLYPGFKNHKLGTIAKELCIEIDNAHRALCDATATARIFIKCLEKLNELDEAKARERKLAKEAAKAEGNL